jgi:hypothetical protein
MLKWRLIALVTVYAGLGFGAAVCVEAGWHARPAQIVFDAVFFAEACLLGVWAGLGSHSKVRRFIGVGLGLTCLGSLTALGLRRSLDGRIGYAADGLVFLWVWLLMLALALVAIAALMAASLVLFKRNFRLVQYAAGTSGLPNVDPLQFSILQLMMLVLAVAVLVKIGPFAQAHLNDYDSYIASMAAVVVGGLCFGGVGILMMFAVFSAGRPVVWSIVAVALSAVIGLVPAYYFPDFLSADVAATSSTTALEAMLIAGALAIVRRCGYRLVSSSGPV